MAEADEVGSAVIRARVYDTVVKQVAVRQYKFKQAVRIVPTSAWKNFFYRENQTVLAGKTGNTTGGIPRGSAFPQAVVQWEQIQTVIKKYGLENNIPWEDIISNDIDVRDRTLFKISEGVTKAVDDEIWDALGGTQDVAGTNGEPLISSFSIINKEWNETSSAIIDDLMRAKQLIAEKNYDTSNLMAFVSPRDYRSIMKWITDKGAQFPDFSNSVAENGRAGKLAGVQLVVSNSVTASNALVCVPQICGTWKELVPLQSTVIEDKYKSITVRAVEMGVTQLTDPKAICLIMGTQSANA